MFSAEAFGFAEAAEREAAALLGRTRADGGGDSFYNLGPEGGPAIRGWITAEGSILDPASAGRPRFRVASGGLEAGADVTLGSGARLGGAIGWNASRYTDSARSSGDEDDVRVGLYGSQTLGPIGLSAALAYDHGWQRLSRASGFGVSKARRDLDAVEGAFQAALPVHAGGFDLTPMAGVIVSYVSAGAFLEHNGLNSAFAVAGRSAHATFASPYAALGVSRSFTGADGLVVTPEAEVGYRYDGPSRSLSQTLIAADGTLFFGNRAALGGSGALLDAAVTAHQGRWSGFLKYQALVAGHWSDQSLDLGLRLAF